MALTTPGIDFILLCLVKIFLPPTLFCSLAKALGFTSSYAWCLVVLPALTFPIFLVGRAAFKTLRNSRLAALHGARLAPVARGKNFGNLDLADFMHEEWEKGYPGDGILKLHRQYGTIYNVRILADDLIITSNPGHIKLVLVSDFQNYVKGKRFQKTMFSVLGNGIFNSDGDMWRFHRSITRPAFTRDRISDFELFEHHSSTVIKLMKERARQGCSLDFQDLMSRFTLDTASSFLFGTCLDSLSSSLPYSPTLPFPPPTSKDLQSQQADAFSRSFLRAQELLSERERYGWAWPLRELWRDKSREPMKMVREYLDKVVKEAITKKAHSNEEKAVGGELREGETLIDHLVRVTDDQTLLRDETLNIMIAGRDTTASTLTFILYLLATHPTVLSRLREEVLERVGSTRQPGYDDIKEMKYLRAVINETLRLFPIVPFNTRDSVNGTVWPSPDPNENPIYIPAGTKVTYSVFVMHRRKDLWGPDAENFDPDRFLDERLHKYLMKNPFIFLPFNAGPRICLGQQFAYNEMSYMLIRLLQNFSGVNLDEGAWREEDRPPRDEWMRTVKGGIGADLDSNARRLEEAIWPKVHLTMHVAGGLWVKMTEAELNIE